MWGKTATILCSLFLLIPINAAAKADRIAPQIKVLPLAKNIAAGKNLEFNVFARDRSGIRTVELHYRKMGKTRFKKLIFWRHQKTNIYKVMLRRIPKQGVEYYIKVTDKHGNTALAGNAISPLAYHIISKQKKTQIASTSPASPRPSRAGFSFNKPIYLGGRLTQTSLEYNAFQQASGGYRLFAGYNFNRYLGVELGYNSNGEAKGVDNNEVQPRYVTMGNSGFDAIGIVNYQLARTITVFAKAGLFLWNADLRLCFDANELDCIPDTDSGTSMIYGFGTRININKKIKVLAELNRYNMKLEPDEVAGNLVTLDMGLSLIYSFK